MAKNSATKKSKNKKSDNKKLNIVFEMEPLARVNPNTSSSLVIMKEAQRRGHTIYQYAPDEITLTLNGVFARARKVSINEGGKKFYSLAKDEIINLSAADVIMMRQDPPFNMEYITSTYLLEAIDKNAFVVNHPVSVRNAPEKLFPFLFREFMPNTVITEDFGAVRALAEAEEKIVIKPLYMFGGNDVFSFEKNQIPELKKMFNKLVRKYRAPVVAQKFIPEVVKGDKRVLFIDGEVVGVFLRVPADGSIRSNIRAGGSLKKAHLNANDRKICDALSPVLKKNGFMICGIDIVDKYLTEINVTSPAGFMELIKLYKKDVSKILWDKIEQKLQ